MKAVILTQAEIDVVASALKSTRRLGDPEAERLEVIFDRATSVRILQRPLSELIKN